MLDLLSFTSPISYIGHLAAIRNEMLIQTVDTLLPCDICDTACGCCPVSYKLLHSRSTSSLAAWCCSTTFLSFSFVKGEAPESLFPNYLASSFNHNGLKSRISKQRYLSTIRSVRWIDELAGSVTGLLCDGSPRKTTTTAWWKRKLS